MLKESYDNLYQSEFYKKQAEFLRKNNPHRLVIFEHIFALANAVYIESQHHIYFTSRNPEDAEMGIAGESELINVILGQNNEVLRMLKEVESFERTTSPSEKLTLLDAAITVCSEHLEKIQGRHK